LDFAAVLVGGGGRTRKIPQNQTERLEENWAALARERRNWADRVTVRGKQGVCQVWHSGGAAQCCCRQREM